MSRLGVRKTYKLYVGGAFVRSESGRYDRATDAGGNHIANVPRGSRKDVRDAVKAARTAAGPWAARTAYNRGQILYRAAEALESRGGELGVEGAELEAAIDVLVHYAGWTDKIQPVLGGINPVAAPFLSFSMPEPTGVVGLVAPDAEQVAARLERLRGAVEDLAAVVRRARGPGPRRSARCLDRVADVLARAARDVAVLHAVVATGLGADEGAAHVELVRLGDGEPAHDTLR